MEYQYEYFASQALGLPKNAWRAFASLPAQRYARGSELYIQGETAEALYYIVSGRVRTYTSSAEGGEKILTVYKSGDILGEAAFFDGMPRVSSARLLTDGKISAVDKPTLLRCMEENSALAFSLLRYLSGTVRMLSTQLNTMTFMPADKRVARLLLNMRKGRGNVILCSHEELGFAAGVTRVTVSRVLGELERRGLVKLGYRKIIIRDAAGLESFVGE
jgi:CRP/FNR family cyclic AMP-dependent transcriptional regulator